MRCVVLVRPAWIFACQVSLLAGHVSAIAATEPPVGQVDLTVEDPRPVAKAAERLATLYGYLITYEDPRYQHADDLRDVTNEVRNDLGRVSMEKQPRTIVPAGGRLELRIIDPDLGRTDHSATVSIRALLDAQAARPNGGQFRLEQTGHMFHILPARVRDQAGDWASLSSVLDVPISLLPADRSGMAQLQAIVEAIQKANGFPIKVGTVPLNVFRPRIHLGAENERARDVLIRALDATGARMTWQLYYAPDLKFYVLNIKEVPEPMHRVQQRASIRYRW